MPRFQKIDAERERKLEEHFEVIQKEEDIRNQERNTQIDENIVPGMTEVSTSQALREVELQERVNRVRHEMIAECGMTKQLYAKLDILLTLAINLNDEEHPIFSLIEAAERELEILIRKEIIVTSNLLTLKTAFSKATDSDPEKEVIEGKPSLPVFEENFERDEESTSDSVISLSALKSNRDDLVHIEPRSFVNKVKEDNQERMGKTVEERARDFREKNKDKPVNLEKKVDYESIEKMRESEAEKELKVPKGLVEIHYEKAAELERAAIRKPASVIIRNKNAIDHAVTEKQISKKNLQRKYNKYKDEKGKYERANRTQRVEGYFGETQITEKKQDEL